MFLPSEGPLQLGQPEAIPPRFDIHLFRAQQPKLTKDKMIILVLRYHTFLHSVETLLPSPDSAFQLGDFFPMVKVTEL